MKSQKTNCLNCKFSYRGKEGVLHCKKKNVTSVNNYDCKDYVVFLENKEDLYEIYLVVKDIEKRRVK